MAMEPEVTSDSIQQAYRRYARFYDFVFGLIFRPGRRKAIELLQCVPGDRILEVGVGTGLSLEMYPSFVRVTGVDLSEDMLRKARHKVSLEKLTHVEALLQMDAQQMTFADNSFDKVVAMYVASVVPDPSALFAEIQRVCRPGGTIIFLNHFQNRRVAVRAFEAAVQPLARLLGFHPDFPLRDFLSRTGFKPTSMIPVNLLDYWTILVGRNDY